MAFMAESCFTYFCMLYVSFKWCVRLVLLCPLVMKYLITPWLYEAEYHSQLTWHCQSNVTFSGKQPAQQDPETNIWKIKSIRHTVGVERAPEFTGAGGNVSILENYFPHINHANMGAALFSLRVLVLYSVGRELGFSLVMFECDVAKQHHAVLLSLCVFSCSSAPVPLLYCTINQHKCGWSHLNIYCLETCAAPVTWCVFMTLWMQQMHHCK